ncbi:MAG TPA: VOC family protein, partial [Gemmatimonadales bacterium]|nr:VOC family protein [Gemmatimonadales bacterium]
MTFQSLASLGLRCIVALLIGATGVAAQSAQPWNGRGIAPPRVAIEDSASPTASQGKTAGARAVEMVGLTVSDMDRSLQFYTQVLDFVKVSDAEVAGSLYETLEGVFGARLRVVRLRLGDEVLQLTQYLAPQGRPFPADSRSNDRWFQHVAIIVSDMDRAYARLRQFKVQH